MSLIFLQPASTPVLAMLNDTVTIEVAANDATRITLFVDGNMIAEADGNYIIEDFIPATTDDHLVKAVAENEDDMIADSFNIVIRPQVEVLSLPEGIRDGINYTTDESVTLSLLAPGKDFVYVIGDFNDWGVNNDYFMKMTPDSLRFWLEIGGLEAGKEYIFQYFIDGDIRVGDPYTDKISDPWNDKYISEQVYPGLIEYPDGKTYGIASVLQTAQGEYNWEIDDFIPPETTDLVIYELLVRDFTEAHSYAAIIDTLDYLARLGINAIEFMPVNEFEGNNSWGYNPSFYFAPDKYYGPKDKLKQLIDECHKRGIAVIMDIVLNHSYDQSPLVQMYFDGNKPTADNPWYNVNHNFSNTDAHWGNDFNHESLYTQQFVDSVNSYWMGEYRFDGFRFDFTKGFSNTYHGSDDPWGSYYDQARIDLLKRMADEIWERNENAIIIIEHLSENLEEKLLANYGFLLWGNLNYNYAEASMAYHDGSKSDFSGISYKKRTWTYPNLVGYMESHDEERIMFKNVSWGNSAGWFYNIQDTSVALDRIRLISTFFYTVPGPKMIWQFGELGYDYSIDYNGRLGEKPVRWDYYQDWRRRYNYDFIAALIALRTENDVFETPDFELEVSDEMKRIRLFSDDMNAVIIGNFDIIQGEIQPLFIHTGPWYDYFNRTTLEVADLEMTIQLEAGEYRIYTDVELESPNISTSIKEPDDRIEKKTLKGSIIPNPVITNARLSVYVPEEARIRMRIINMMGIEVVAPHEQDLDSGKHGKRSNNRDLVWE
ncbi:MAG TPA: alpha-amylase family glycosyl hydrolase, partial [Bacteroidales bacterium]|nr:alpha-amylase family glycosyl hydrolase [Bacteroidales bacterium]